MSCLPLLAFGFASHLVLSGLALAGIPILIHLLHRRHFIETRWAAMRFLIQASQKQSRRSRLEQLLLLLIRTLAIVAFVLALARPLSQNTVGAISGTTAVHRIVVLDASYSMQYRDLETLPAESNRVTEAATRFERMREQARDLVKSAQPGDVWNLVRASRREPRVLIPRATGSTDFVLSELEALKVSDSSCDLLDVLPDVLELTQQMADVPEKEVVIYTDSQASFIAPSAPERLQKTRDFLQRIGRVARLNVVNAALGSSSNISVTDIRSERPYGLIDRPTRLLATLRNSGPALKNQVVELLVDDRLVETKRVDLPSDAVTTVDWSFTINTPGEHIVEVHLADDALPIDNRRRMSLLVRDELRVVIVDSHGEAQPRSASTAFYVSRALAPDQSDKPTSQLIRPTIIAPGDFSNTSLQAIDVLVLCGVWRMTDREIRQLEAFVRSGHGLLLFPDDSTTAEVFNDSVYRQGAGPAPGSFQSRVTNANVAEPWKFDAQSSTHVLLREFQRNPGTGLEATLVFQQTQIAPHADSSVPLKLTNGSAAILERRYGTGVVLMMTTNPESSWSTWGVLGQSFVPILHEAVLHAAAKDGGANLEVGQVLVQRLPTGQPADPIVVRRPNGTAAVPQIVGQAGQEQLVFDEVDTVGVYRLDAEHRVSDRTLFCANAESVEGVLTMLDPAPLVAEFNQFTAASEPGALVGMSTGTGSTRLIRGLLMAALVLLLIEPFVAYPGRKKSWTASA